MTKYVVTPLLDRIVAKLDIGLCWEFTGALMGGRNGGYGVIGRGRRGEGNALVHRAVWEALVGPIPAGLDLDHLCRNRQCCNPDHLEPVTRKVNANRGRYAAGYGAWRFTHCRQGHEFTPENTFQGKRQRHCKTCMAARARARRQKENAAA